MKTIIVASQKGGSGKTTLVSHLAVEAERAGDGPAWMIDTDRQATLSQWHERREAETPQRADVPFSKLGAGLDALAKGGAAYCLIDTAPALSDQNTSLLRLADLVLIPVRPSPADLWAVAETVEQVKDVGKPLLFVITQAKPQASITAQPWRSSRNMGRLRRRSLRIGCRTRSPWARPPSWAPRVPPPRKLPSCGIAWKSCFHEINKIRKVSNG